MTVLKPTIHSRVSGTPKEGEETETLKRARVKSDLRELYHTVSMILRRG